MEQSPTVRGRRLCRELKRLREASGLSIEEAARRLDFSKSKLSRIENGRSRVITDDLEDMLDLYDVRSPQREALIQLGRDARRRGWWTKYSDVFTGSYVGLESEAAKIRVNAHLIPGFLQTENYARGIITSTRPMFDTAEVDRRVAARAARREALLRRTDPPEIHVILDESAVRRHVGGTDAMRQQLTDLIEAGKRPNITLQVLPFAAGGHAGVEGEFVVLVFPDPEDAPVAYVEGLMGDVYLESDSELDMFNLAWDHMLERALDPNGSIAFLEELSTNL
ncbi:transcriptional regulator [Actinomadura sp. NBRC 104412]|uniref:helix-turn-helix domain-containing protein n=1 Tax=Actinomadura sp. NBRC 104412 TaxID=3032203 RepID=UPI0024A276D7|nr:helix-turn-helix transcriptional regulator [Actinomadura sp. NBRC 104412]GLZ09625.1 transcriptional regulator [Actinomadura sp. NBRC 104412]